MIGADRFVNYLDPDRQASHATQRYARGYSDIDMWNLDGFLADVIVAGCDWYISQGKSSPWHLESSRWVEILTQIRDGFARGEDGVPDPPGEAWVLLQQYFAFMWD